MKKKVYELAKEMGIQSKDLIAKAGALGIEVKSHMSALTEADIDKIKGSSKEKKMGKKPPVGKPIVDNEYLANKPKPPVGKPIVDESIFANRDKAEKKDNTDVKTEKEVRNSTKSVEKKEKMPKKETQRANRKENKEDHKIAEPKEIKNTESKEAKNIEPEEVKKEDSKTVRKLASEKENMPRIKIVAKAEDVVQEEAARKAARAERVKKEAERKSGENKSDRKTSGDRKNDKKNGNRRGEGANGQRDGRSGNNRNSRSDRKDTRQGAEGKSGRNNRNDRRRNDRGEGKEFNRGDRNGNRAQRSGAPQNRSGGSAAPGSEGKGGRNRRDDRRTYGRKEEHNKFSKLERKSLEKKERKKYVKPKQEMTPEVVEEILPEGTFKVDLPITVAGFCEQTEISTSKVIMSLMKLGIMANINQNIDEDTMMVLAEELGINVIAGTVKEETVEEGIEDFTDREKDLKDRPPIITVMGHVDHGKTSLLDAIRSTNVTKSESGGITQHIGASEVSVNGQKIVFLDTPGHEAFTAMRARGAHITDIAVLVVAADDSVKPQTIESISHAKAAGVPIIVAINKMDKPGANPDRVKKDLADNEVLVEDWGGDVISVPVSAKNGDGIQNLLEMILLQAEVMELKANPNRLALGSIIEAKLDKSRGPVASLLVLNGTLQAGQSIVAGTCSGRIRLMTDYRGRQIKKAGPATAVEILGLTDVPQAGDEFNAVRDDKTAREIAGRRQEKLREEVLAKNSSMTLDKLFSQIQEGEVKELNLIIKGDVQGSVGALISSLEKLNNEDVKVNIVHSGVGTVIESDIMLAETSNAVIVGFNVRPSTAMSTMADRHGVEMRLYRVIYDVINDIEAAMRGMLDPEFKEEVLGKAQIRNTFKVPGVGIIGGAYITEGKVVRNESIRLVRDGIVIHEGKISSLKRFKDDAKEVAQGYECGIGIEAYNDIKEEDVIECFTMVEIERA